MVDLSKSRLQKLLDTVVLLVLSWSKLINFIGTVEWPVGCGPEFLYLDSLQFFFYGDLFLIVARSRHFLVTHVEELVISFGEAVETVISSIEGLGLSEVRL